MADFVLNITAKQTIEKFQFDFYGIQLDTLIELGKAVKSEIFHRTTQLDFKDERAQYAENSGVSTGDLVKKQLKLNL